MDEKEREGREEIDREREREEEIDTNVLVSECEVRV